MGTGEAWISWLERERENDIWFSIRDAVTPVLCLQECPSVYLNAYRPGPWRIFLINVQKANVVSAKRGQQRFAPNCSQMRWNWRSLQCFRTKTSPSQKLTTTLRELLSFARAMIFTMDARRLQRTHLLSGMGSSLNASKWTCVGVTDLALVVNQNQ